MPTLPSQELANQWYNCGISGCPTNDGVEPPVVFAYDHQHCAENVARMAAEIAALACPDPRLHLITDAPLRPLADLLRAATEFDEIAGHLVDEYDLLAIEIERINALRAAVRDLNGGAS